MVVFSGILCATSPIIALSAFFIGLTGCFFVDRGRRIAATLVAAACPFLIVAAFDENRTMDYQNKYPIVSLAGPLEYETKHSHKPKTSLHLTSDNEARLRKWETLEEAYEYSYTDRRANTLEHLHKSVIERFISNPGFGVARTIPKRFRDLRELGRVDAARERAFYLLDSQPDRSSASRFHDNYSLDFAHPLSFGFVRDRNYVIGFESHRIRKSERFPVELTDWTVTKLELVSLLKFDSPRVYISEDLPAMDQLRDAPTRTLDIFEEESLESLRLGNDMEVLRSGEEMRSFGSLRASSACLKCHEVERGELLGAFSYRFAPEGVK